MPRALAAADVEGCVRLAQELVRTPSLTGDERAAQERVAEAMRESRVEVDLFEADLDSLRSTAGFPGMEVDRDEAVLVVGTCGPRGGPSLILNGHVDVVPPGTREWRRAPFGGEIADGRLHGRGSCDMKSGLAVAVFAARALVESGVELKGRLIVQSVVGEEDGGVGTFALIERGYHADAAVVLEPTRLRIAAAQAGALSFRLVITGTAAHAAVRYEGESALDLFLPIYDALRELERELNDEPHPLFAGYPVPYPLSIGIVRAGEWSAMVPDRLIAEGRVGVPVGTASSEIRRRLEAAVDGRAAVEWFGGQFDAAESSRDHRAFSLLREAHARELGSEPDLEGVPYGSDMRLLVNLANIPTVVYGPGDIRVAHQVDESIDLEEVGAALRVVTATAAAYLTD